MWTQREDGSWQGNVQRRPDGEPTRRLDSFAAEQIRNLRLATAHVRGRVSAQSARRRRHPARRDRRAHRCHPPTTRNGNWKVRPERFAVQTQIGEFTDSSKCDQSGGRESLCGSKDCRNAGRPGAAPSGRRGATGLGTPVVYPHAGAGVPSPAPSCPTRQNRKATMHLRGAAGSPWQIGELTSTAYTREEEWAPRLLLISNGHARVVREIEWSRSRSGLPPPRWSPQCTILAIGWRRRRFPPHGSGFTGWSRPQGSGAGLLR